MSNLRIQNSNLHVEAVKAIRQGIKLDDNELRAQLTHDGLDEVVFQKGNDVFIAYGTNLDLSQLKVNADEFSQTGDQQGQLFANNQPIQVLFVDDENKESFWVSPYKAIAKLLDDPATKAAATGFIGGVISGVTAKSSLSEVSKIGLYAGSGLGTAAASLRGEAEIQDKNWKGMAVTSGFLGYTGGHIAGRYLHGAADYVAHNPKVAIGVAAGTAAVVGAGLLLDAISDSRKVPNYSVVQEITR